VKKYYLLAAMSIFLVQNMRIRRCVFKTRAVSVVQLALISRGRYSSSDFVVVLKSELLAKETNNLVLIDLISYEINIHSKIISLN